MISKGGGSGGGWEDAGDLGSRFRICYPFSPFSAVWLCTACTYDQLLYFCFVHKTTVFFTSFYGNLPFNLIFHHRSIQDLELRFHNKCVWRKRTNYICRTDKRNNVMLAILNRKSIGKRYILNSFFDQKLNKYFESNTNLLTSVVKWKHFDRKLDFSMKRNTQVKLHDCWKLFFLYLSSLGQHPASRALLRPRQLHRNSL